MAPGMNGPLYTTEILRLAASLHEPHALEREDGLAELRSPTCGSRIRLAVQLDSDRRNAPIRAKLDKAAAPLQGRQFLAESDAQHRLRHRDHEEGNRQSGGCSKPPRHVHQFGILFFLGRDGEGAGVAG